MKRDCPHCNQPMGGRFVEWRKFANMDPNRNCRACGGEIQLRTFPEEIGLRILTILVAMGAGYAAKERGGGYLSILVAATLVLVVAYVLAHLRLRNQQRFERRR